MARPDKKASAPEASTPAPKTEATTGSPDREALAALPAVDGVLRLLPDLPGATAAVRESLEVVRQALRNGTHQGPVPDAQAVADLARARVSGWSGASYPRVVNATGILLHTGLGRAPLSPVAAEAVARLATGYSLLEVDAVTGERKDRESRLLEDLTALTGAESATVVNNNAAALLLALTALAQDKDVLVSRGELIEIGGGFRLPDLLAQSGAHMVEVGTTNRTYARDYAEVLRWETGLVLSMHTSNFRVVGFQHSPSREELVSLAGDCAVPVLEDIGSGLLVPAVSGDLCLEPDARTSLEAGVDLVCFSGDKLLGGPQAGILLGSAELIARCRRHPLFRALRPDRLCLAALGATLRLHREAPGDVPVLAALQRSPAQRRAMAQQLATELASGLGEAASGVELSVVESEASAGSGSLPARPLSSWAVEVVVPGRDGDELLSRLRVSDPPVFAKLWQGRLRFDVAALLPGDGARTADSLAAVLGGTP